jgi:DNA-binding GntR family transcriptional regulator
MNAMNRSNGGTLTPMPRGHETPRAMVARDVRRRIQDGEWKPGEALPTSRTMAAEYGVALGTWHAAVKLLVDEGLLETNPGWSVTVKP